MDVTPEMRAAYRATDYHVEAPEGGFVLRIGETSAWVRSRLAAHPEAGAVFVTAWNPFSVECSAADNARANESLEAELRASCATVLPGRGVGEEACWSEDSFLALPIAREAALELCRRHVQAAVVFVPADGVPELLFHPDARLP